jgi:outer membrane receptor for ferrienterochelin and colicins
VRDFLARIVARRVECQAGCRTVQPLPTRSLRHALSVFGAFVIAVHPALGQEPEGTVLVQVTSGSEPVANAEVRAIGIRAFTDESGVARLTLPAGDVRIEVRRFGFKSDTAQVRIEPGREASVVVELRAAVLEAEGIVVTSTRTGRRVQDEPLRIEVLDREEIEEKMLMTPGNIAMLLNETGGLRVQVTSPSLGAANIRIQGMRGRYTQLLADGLPLYGGQAGAIGLLQIPPTDLGQVEVIKGVASALYGASALGGVINLVSRRPADERSTELLLNASSQNGQDVTAYMSGPLVHGWGYSALGGAHRQSRQDLDGSGWADVPAHRRWSVRPRVFWDGQDGRRVFITVGGMTEERDGGTLPERTSPEGGSFPESLDTDRVDAGLTAQWPVSGIGSLQLRASGMAQEHGHRFGTVRERDRHGTAFGEAALSGTSGRHTWVVGGAVQRDSYRSRTFPDFDYAFIVPALFVQDEVRLSSNVSASASLRWDEHSEYGTHLSPRLSALYRPGPWTVRASVGGGFFAPTPFTEEIEAAGLSFLEPLDDLRSERARSGSLDVGRVLGAIELNAVLFGSRVENAVQLVPVDGPGSDGTRGVQVVNVPGETRTLGTELLGRYRWNDISVTGSYVYVRATEPDPTAPVRRDVPLTPRHTAGLVAMWEDHDRGLLGVEAYYTGRQPLDDNPFRSDGRPHVHLGVLGEVRRGDVSLFLNAENLLNVRQTRHDPLVRNERAPDGRWTVDAWAPIEGFVVNGGVRIRFGG